MNATNPPPSDFDPASSGPPPLASPPLAAPPLAAARVVVLVIIAVTLIGGVLLLGGTMLGLGRGHVPLAIRPEDREVLVTATDLLPFAPDLLVRTDGEKVRRFRMRDGRSILRYEYEHPDPDREMKMVCEIIVEPTEDAATADFANLSARLTPSGNGPEDNFAFEPAPTGWDGEFKFGLLTSEGKPIGFLAIGQLSDRLYGLRVIGLAIDPDDILYELAGPLRANLAGYQP